MDPDPKTTSRREDVPAETEAGRTRRRRGRHRYEDRRPGTVAYRPRGTTGGWAYADAGAESRAVDSGGPPRATIDDDTGEWAHRPDLYERGAPAGEDGWDREAHTGEWHSTDTGEWSRLTDTGEWRRLTDTGEWDRDGPDTARRADQIGQLPPGWPETFWEGLRLAGDDPRWVPTPASAPRSPVVGDIRPPDDSPALPMLPQADPGPPNHRVQLDPNARLRGVLMALLYAAAWYLVPLLLLFSWMLTLDGTAPAGCMTDASGGGCESERAAAITSIVAAAPRFWAAIGASLVAALVLSWVSRWQAASVSLAAAVIGGGLSIMLFQLFWTL